MTPSLRRDRWTARDRLLAAACVVYMLVGIAQNYARVSPRVGERGLIAVTIAAQLLVGVLLLFFVGEIVRRRRSLETLGFTVGTWQAVALTVVVGVYLVGSLRKVPLTTASAAAIGVPLTAVLAEEILFRPVLISFLRGGGTRTRGSWALAVVASAALWTVVHVPSKSASLLVGLFVTGVLLGALYAWSGTNVVGYVLHALANSGMTGAVIMFGLCLVLGAGGWLNERRRWRDVTPDGEAHDKHGPPPG